MIITTSPKRAPTHTFRNLLLCAALTLVVGCQAAQTDRSSAEASLLKAGEPVVLLPFVNRSETPLAGERAKAIALSVLRRNGMSELQMLETPASPDGLPVLDDSKRLADAKEAAKTSGASHALTGSVEEWRYKSGLDGEPAVGLSLLLVDLESDKVVWSGSAARSGWSRESLAGAAQKVLQELANDFIPK